MGSRPLPRIAVLFFGIVVLASPARADTEWVIILDNSVSMVDGMTIRQQGKPDIKTLANDPERLSVLATLVFRAFLEPSKDTITILNFDGSAVGRYKVLPPDPQSIRKLEFNQNTPFTGPLRQAREILTHSPRANRILLLVTDGTPSEEDPLTSDDARRLLGLDSGPQIFDVITLGLSRSPEVGAQMKQFLGPIGQLREIDSPDKLVHAFTDVFAQSIRSRPQTGRLESGGAFTFPVGRYVTEVIVGASSEKRTGPFEATLAADGKTLTGSELFKEGGDNGCATPPCHHYNVLKAPHDPTRESRWSLNLVRSSGPIVYGIVLRYDLAAEIVRAPSTARVGEEIEIAARMTWRGKTFNDEPFFNADGFKASLTLSGVEVPLARQPDGTFTGKVKVTRTGAQKVQAHFTNHWLDLAPGADLKVDDWIPLSLSVHPDPLDFGTWTGERTESVRCADVDFAGSQNAELVPLEAISAGLPEGLTVDDAVLVVKDGKGKVCLRAPGCCKSAASTAGTRITIRGKDPHYHLGAATVGARFQLEPTPFLRCWWRVIAGTLATLFLIFLIVGIVRPRDFATDEVIRLAKTEQALGRASARRLRDLPGGRRGFYRDARVAFDGAGNASRNTSGSVITLRAAKGDPLVTMRGTVELKDPRTRKWEPVPVEKGGTTLRKNVIYRSGDFLFKLG